MNTQSINDLQNLVDIDGDDQAAKKEILNFEKQIYDHRNKAFKFSQKFAAKVFWISGSWLIFVAIIVLLQMIFHHDLGASENLRALIYSTMAHIIALLIFTVRCVFDAAKSSDDKTAPLPSIPLVSSSCKDKN